MGTRRESQKVDVGERGGRGEVRTWGRRQRETGYRETVRLCQLELDARTVKQNGEPGETVKDEAGQQMAPGTVRSAWLSVTGCQLEPDASQNSEAKWRDGTWHCMQRMAEYDTTLRLSAYASFSLIPKQ